MYKIQDDYREAPVFITEGLSSIDTSLLIKKSESEAFTIYPNKNIIELKLNSKDKKSVWIFSRRQTTQMEQQLAVGSWKN